MAKLKEKKEKIIEEMPKDWGFVPDEEPEEEDFDEEDETPLDE